MGGAVSFIEDTVGGAVDAVGDVVEGAGEAVGSVVQNVSDVLADIDDNIIQPAVKIVSTTINNALKDPVGTIAKIATAVYAPYLLPYVNAASVLANGGSMDDAFKAGALTWVGQEAFANLNLGTETLPEGFVGPPEAITANYLLRNEDTFHCTPSLVRTKNSTTSGKRTGTKPLLLVVDLPKTI